MTGRSPRKPGLALVGTVAGPAEASDWQDRLREEGIASIVRGHRAEGDPERRPSFAAVDVFVPAMQLARAGSTLGLAEGIEEVVPAFPWVWVIAVPLIAVLVLAGITLVVS